MTNPTRTPATSPDEEASAEAIRLTLMAQGFMHSQALYVIARMGIANEMLESPRTIPDLAAAVGADTDSLRRLMRIAANFGLFREVSHDTYSATSMGRRLAADVEGSMADLLITWMESHYETFGHLIRRIRTGEPGFRALNGTDFFTWLEGDPEQLGYFTRAMRNFTEGVLTPLLSDYQLPPGRLVVDLGGGDGSLIAALLKDEPDRKGIILERPELTAPAQARMRAEGLESRVHVIAGDFFESVPTADTYLLKYIFHDWNDENCVRLLNSISRAAQPGARVIVIEGVIPPGDEPHPVKAADLTMLGMLEGKERTEAEFRTLLTAAGFRLDRVVPTATFYSILEATRL
ncbi:methyltransferase [Actinoplanes sp. TBRC 11911]|uniref:methyltransferase n=1 Tax=Actinoplanes sp. TBRC 11911 TaxID=2729386 RepID=UPI00145C4D22|nr:methyltransferase [Actinoplanes sp. TBRC 11911]NMO55395.1 methyltransferase [Actinoplanes sp. TBRC 11911]